MSPVSPCPLSWQAALLPQSHRSRPCAKHSVELWASRHRTSPVAETQGIPREPPSCRYHEDILWIFCGYLEWLPSSWTTQIDMENRCRETESKGSSANGPISITSIQRFMIDQGNINHLQILPTFSKLIFSDQSWITRTCKFHTLTARVNMNQS